MTSKLTITDMQNIANHNGGKCLSKEYIDEHSSLEWMCEKGHRWESAFKVVNQGGWCVQCLKKQQRKEEKLEEMKAIAIEHGGKCLSTEYLGFKNKLEFECAEGHKWEASGTGLVAGRWCPKCSYIWRGKNQSLTLATYQKIAEEHGGECLTTEYVGCFDMFEWKCAEGHIWKALAHNIKRGLWCQKCSAKRNADPKRDVIETFYKIASERGGKCLSKEYSNSYSKLEFQCSKEHVWKTDATNVKNGSWCPVCNLKRIKKRTYKNYKKRKTEE